MFYRHKDIVPYEENRVRLSPTKENRYGYINASNITVSLYFINCNDIIYLLFIINLQFIGTKFKQNVLEFLIDRFSHSKKKRKIMGELEENLISMLSYFIWHVLTNRIGTLQRAVLDMSATHKNFEIWSLNMIYCKITWKMLYWSNTKASCIFKLRIIDLI